MTEQLSHAESNIISQGTGLSGKPMMAYLREINAISDTEQLPRKIPDTVFLQHYVEFRIILRG